MKEVSRQIMQLSAPLHGILGDNMAKFLINKRTMASFLVDDKFYKVSVTDKSMIFTDNLLINCTRLLKCFGNL